MKEAFNLEDIKEAISNNAGVKKDHVEYESSWDLYNSPLVEFGSTFYKTLPEEYVGYMDKKIYVEFKEYGDAFKKYIENTLSQSKDKDNLSAIEFGGPGTNLFNGFSRKFFKHSVGVCLNDLRDHHQKLDDAENDHTILQGDLFNVNNEKLNNDIKEGLGKEKADLIISRLMGPLHRIDKHPVLLERVIRKWYSMLEENGIIFAQFEYFPEHDRSTEKKYIAEIEPKQPSETELYATYWVQELRKLFPDTLDLQLGRGVIRIHKKAGAPQELPPSKEFAD